ncbi:MAG: hypothetical protein ACFFAU_01185 [Candidatus Hodarchaeota archaeon]
MFDKFYTPEEIVKMDAEYQIHKAINKFGLEGTEDKIRELYKYSEGLMNYLLGILYDFWRKK